MELIAKIIAKNPPSILFVIGGFLEFIGNHIGLAIILMGVGLQVLWLTKKFG